MEPFGFEFNSLWAFQYYFPGAFAVAALGTGLAGVITLLRSMAGMAWGRAPGTITGAELEVSEDSEGDNLYYRPVLTYQYTVDGKQYTSDLLAFGAHKHTYQDNRGKKKAEAKLAEYPVGKQVEVRYNPSNPASAVLEVRAAGVVTLLVVSAICGCGAVGTFGGLAWLQANPF